jgi:hypothetical protein
VCVCVWDLRREDIQCHWLAVEWISRIVPSLYTTQYCFQLQHDVYIMHQRFLWYYDTWGREEPFDAGDFAKCAWKWATHCNACCTCHTDLLPPRLHGNCTQYNSKGPHNETITYSIINQHKTRHTDIVSDESRRKRSNGKVIDQQKRRHTRVAGSVVTARAKSTTTFVVVERKCARDKGQYFLLWQECNETRLDVYCLSERFVAQQYNLPSYKQLLH